MSLIDKFLPKKEIQQYFLALCVEEQRISAAVAKIDGTLISIIGTGESEWSSKENEVEAADIAISTAEKNLPENVLVEKVIFGLPVLFIEKDKIKEEHLSRLQKISKELALTPIGFIEYPQALAYLFENKEESPPTAILLSIGRNYLTLSLLRVGKIENNLIVERSSSLSLDFEKVITGFQDEILPSRIILYDEIGNAPLEEIREELLNFPWHKNASFLHTPKIEILPKSIITTAIVEATGGNILKEMHIEEKKEEVEGEKAEYKEAEKADIDFGFVKDKDIAKTIETTVEKPQTPPQKESLIDSSKKLLTNLPLEKLSFSLPTIPISVPLLIMGIITILFIACLYFFYPEAIVKLIVDPLITTKQLEVNFTSDSSRLKELKNAILGKMISEDISGEKTIPSTGKTNVGDRARGSVTIYNKTLTSKTLPKGTFLTNGTLKFTLDDEIHIASSSDTGEGLTFGKTSAKITASEIGPEGNLSTGSIFIIKDFPESSLYAKNSQPLSGGSSRQVTSVSKDDQEQLLASLSAELTNSVKQKLMQKINPGEQILEDSIEKNITAKKFSQEAGTEAKELSLSLSLNITALVFQETDLTVLTKESSSSLEGYTLDNSRTNVKVEEKEVSKKGDIKALSSITFFYIPTIDKEKTRREIAGKTYEEVNSYLSKKEHIAGFEIVKVQELPLLGTRLPKREENITIQIVPR